MLIFYLISIIIVILGIKNLKLGFLWLLIFKVFLVQNISLIDIPGLPLLTVEVGLTLVYVILFLQKRRHIGSNPISFPYKVPFIIIAVSWFLSAVFSRIGFIGAASQLLKDICQSLITVWMMWELVEEEKDFKFLFKWFTIAFLIAGIYALYEKSIGSNPLQDYYVTLMADSEKTINFQYDDALRGQRVQSIFEHPIGSGINFAMYIIFAISTLYIFRIKVRYSLVAVIVTIISIPCVLMSNSRGPILFLMIGIFMFLNIKSGRTYKILIGGGIAVLLLLPVLSEYLNIVLSIFDSSLQDKVGGSDANMRMEQLAASIMVAKDSPLVGLGQKYQNIMSSTYIDALLGMESIWFRVITTYGIIGVIAYLISAYYAMIKIPKLFKSRYVFFLALAYWATNTLTSIPGFLDHMYYLLLIYFIKNSDNYRLLRTHYFNAQNIDYVQTQKQPI